MKIVLASGSPRRKEILENMNLKFDIIKSEIDETTIEGESPEDLVKRLLNVILMRKLINFIYAIKIQISIV